MWLVLFVCLCFGHVVGYDTFPFLSFSYFFENAKEVAKSRNIAERCGKHCRKHTKCRHGKRKGENWS